MKKLILAFTITVLAAFSLIGQVNITFELNTATLPDIDPGGLYIAGGSGTCETTGIYGRELDETLFNLRPSLARDFTELAFSEKAAHLRKDVQVFSAGGQLMLAFPLSRQATYRIGTGDYPNGLYFVRILAAGKTYTRKFVVQH